MEKLLNKTGVALGVALAISASNAMAAGSFEAITSESIGVEAATTGTLTADLPADAVVLTNGFVYPTGAGARLIISLTGGATFADTTYTLEQSAGGAGNGDLSEWSLAGGSPVGATSIEFILAASNSGGLATGSDFILNGSSVHSQPVTFTVPSLTAGSELDVDAQYKDSPSTIVEEYTAGELFQYANEFSAGVDTLANGVIDVNDARQTFTGAVSTDVVALDFYQTAPTNGVTLTDTDTVDVVLSGDMSGIASIAVTTGAVSRGNMTIDTATNTATFSISASDAFAAGSASLTATVDGSTLATRSFTAQADLNFETETDKNVVAAATSAGSWTINGLQAKVSHLSLNSTGFISWLKVVNEGTTAAEISADVIYTLADGTEGSVSSATLGTVDAGGVFTVSEASILAAIGDPTQLVDASLTVTVAGPVDSVHLVAEKKASDGRLPVPVYYNITGGSARSWVQ